MGADVKLQKESWKALAEVSTPGEWEDLLQGAEEAIGFDRRTQAWRLATLAAFAPSLDALDQVDKAADRLDVSSPTLMHLIGKRSEEIANGAA